MTTAMPNIHLTEQAIAQIKLILENDFTLEGQSLRVHISGKECDGFTYSIGFQKPIENDISIPCPEIGEKHYIIMDPFSAFYLKEVTVDFVQDFEKDIEGFVVTNHKQEDYHGKFWRKDTNKRLHLLSALVIVCHTQVRKCSQDVVCLYKVFAPLTCSHEQASDTEKAICHTVTERF